MMLTAWPAGDMVVCLHLIEMPCALEGLSYSVAFATSICICYPNPIWGMGGGVGGGVATLCCTGSCTLSGTHAALCPVMQICHRH